MSTVNQISGGLFQDNEGNPLANGYLLLELSQDCTVNTTTQVCSNCIIKVPLDVNGNVVVSPVYSLWPNDVLTPSGTFYFISAYTVNGELVWGPNCNQILSSPSPFVLGALIPGDV
jgi:hypothetical protein